MLVWLFNIFVDKSKQILAITYDSKYSYFMLRLDHNIDIQDKRLFWGENRQKLWS
jgi:hypothetical protein